MEAITKQSFSHDFVLFEYLKVIKFANSIM